jgi:ligand-binding sensor domain-containing protein
MINRYFFANFRWNMRLISNYLLKHACIQVPVFLLSFFMSLNVFCQEPALKSFDITKGLASNECYRVIQDKKGYIWVASDRGVSRYNGYTFQNFTKKDSLPDNVVINLFEDAKGRIWFIGLNKRIVYFENEAFYPLNELNSFLAKKGTNIQIHSAFIDDKDNIHLGFNVFYPYLLTYSLLKNKITAQKPIEHNSITIMANKLNNFIYSTSSWYSRNSNKIRKTYFDLLYAQIKLTIEQEGKIIFSSSIKNRTEATFVHYLALNSDSILVAINEKLFLIKGQEISKVQDFKQAILSLYKDHKNRIWALIYNNGAYVFEKPNLFNSKPKHLFEGLSLSSIIEDKEGSYWLSSLQKGVYQIPNYDIEHYPVKENDKNIKMNVVAKYNNKICTGGQSNRIYEFNNSNALTKYFDLPDKSTEVFNLLARKNTLFIAGNISYIATNLANRVYPVKIITSNNLEGSYLKYINEFKINTDTIVVAGSRYYFKINLKTPRIASSSFIPPTSIYNIYTDTSSKRIYLACINGFYYMPDVYLPCANMADKLFSSIKKHFVKYEEITGLKPHITTKNFEFYCTPDNYLAFSKVPGKLLDTRVNHIIKKDTMFILSSEERGLIFWDGKKTWNMDASNGLASNTCKKALLDGQGNIWVATNKGLSKIELQANGKFEINNLTNHEGLTSDDIYNFSIIDDEVWIPTENGVTKFSTHMWIKNNIPPPVYITGIAVDDSSYKVKTFSEIPYHHNYIKINYNGLSYKNNGDLTYEYRLTGLDTNWKKTRSTQIQFTRLAAGEYSFEVKAFKNNTLASPKTAVFSFIIYPPWYKTWWFSSISIAGITSIMYFFFWIRFKRLKAREEEKTKLVTLVTETEIKALRAQTNPHFIFNALNSISLFVLKNDSDQAQFYLMRFAQLMRDVLENSEHDVIGLGKEFSILKTYMELEVLRFGGKYKFDIIIPEDLLNAKIIIPPLLLQPIIENAIWHGLMPLEDRDGLLVLKAKKDANAVTITVEDNGIGRKRSAEIKLGKSSHKTSKGIFMTKNRIDLFNNKHTEKIKIITTDLIDTNNNPTGTKVELIIENI